MPRMIQLRHVPDDLHGKLKARASLEGLSLSDYLLQEVRRVAERLFAAGETLHAPHLLDLEVAQVLRCYARSGELDEVRGGQVTCSCRTSGSSGTT